MLLYSLSGMAFHFMATIPIKMKELGLNFNIVNKEAMELKCIALHKRGKHSPAKNTYQNFCSEYRILYGEDYGRTFQEIINPP